MNQNRANPWIRRPVMDVTYERRLGTNPPAHANVSLPPECVTSVTSGSQRRFLGAPTRVLGLVLSRLFTQPVGYWPKTDLRTDTRSHKFANGDPSCSE